MKRPEVSSATESDTPLRVLARLPYVDSAEDEQQPQTYARAAHSRQLKISEPVRWGLILGIAAVLLVGITWYIAGRGSKSEKVAQVDSGHWEVEVPRPDAPEAPPWAPPTASVEGLSAQPGTANAGPSSPAVKSPLGFDLPPGNVWGPAANSGMSSPANVTSSQNAIGPADGLSVPPQQSPNDIAVAGSQPGWATGTTTAGAVNGGPASWPQQGGAANLTPQQPASPPWANAAGQTTWGTAAAAQASSAGVNAANAPSANLPAVSGAQEAPFVVQNPYYSANPQAYSPTSPAVPPTAANSPSAMPAGYGMRPPAAYVASRTDRIEGQMPTAAGSAGLPIPQSPVAAGYAPVGQPRANTAGYPTAGYPAVGATTAAGWNTSLPPQPSANSYSPQVTPNAPSSQLNSNNYSNYAASYPAARPDSVPQSQASAVPNSAAMPWNIPQESVAPPAVPAGAWGYPGTNNGGPVYPSSAPNGPTDRYQPQAAPTTDSQVVPATYANPANGNVPMPQGRSAGGYPTSGWSQNPAASQYPANGQNNYSASGQNSYSLYPSTTLR